MSLRICILETDVLRPELAAQYQGYGRMFEQLFERQTTAAQFRVFNVMNGHYPDDSETFDAYLVTGSKADSFADDPWITTLKAYLLKLYARGEKLLGVCFGHQLLALTLGGKAERANQGWGVGTHRYRLAAHAPWMDAETTELTLLISHQDQVTELPKGATLIASSDFCPNAAYCIGDQVLCFQGHPEFVNDYSRALLDARQEHLGDEVYARAVASLATAHQGDLVGEWMLRFIGHAPDKVSSKAAGEACTGAS
ncbi:amidotransferase [Pseudomonas sp.]|uniref:amidotransferase n=1 Tax=Pseudomonas sp. TaxID=306 RepID=UPI0028A63695|nr:amidotransferase [Pseudomonas sp.]